VNLSVFIEVSSLRLEKCDRDLKHARFPILSFGVARKTLPPQASHITEIMGIAREVEGADPC